MFDKFSLTATGLIGLAISYGLTKLGFEASMESIDGLVKGVLNFASVVMAFVGQVRRKDLEYGMFRK